MKRGGVDCTAPRRHWYDLFGHRLERMIIKMDALDRLT